VSHPSILTLGHPVVVRAKESIDRAIDSKSVRPPEITTVNKIFGVCELKRADRKILPWNPSRKTVTMRSSNSSKLHDQYA
jgi:hypothetical protein